MRQPTTDELLAALSRIRALHRTPGLPWERLDVGNRAAWIASVQAVRRAIEEV